MVAATEPGNGPVLTKAVVRKMAETSKHMVDILENWDKPTNPRHPATEQLCTRWTEEQRAMMVQAYARQIMDLLRPVREAQLKRWEREQLARAKKNFTAKKRSGDGPVTVH